MLSVLNVHNYYRQAGGEDRVFADETALLEQHGHTVIRYEDHNDRISKTGLGAFSTTVWSAHSYRRLRLLLGERSCGIAHFHNTFPLISPAAYFAARNAGLPVVQTLHNYRLICPAATLLRNGSVCEECVERRSLLPAVVHGCYRNSRAATTAVATMLTVHRSAGTWDRMVDVYIALSDFARRKFIAGGLPAERIVVKPNFVAPDPRQGEGEGGYALFAGRLSEEKGIGVLIDAWKRLSGGVPLYVVGDGPLKASDWPAGITSLGQQPHEKVLALMRNARVLIFPSICYECAPMTVVEAFACGLPVIAANIGSVPEFVTHGCTGLLFRSGDAEDLARNVRWTFDHPENLQAMRRAARNEYEQKCTAERNYRMLMDIYEMAIENARKRRRGEPKAVA